MPFGQLHSSPRSFDRCIFVAFASPSVVLLAHGATAFAGLWVRLLPTGAVAHSFVVWYLPTRAFTVAALVYQRLL